MPKKDEERVVLRRGMAEHGWRTDGYQPPVRLDQFRWRRRQASDEATSVPEVAIRLHRWGKGAIGGLIALALIVGLGWLSVRGFHADGVSMEPTLHDGDSVFINKLAYSQLDFGLLDWVPLVDPDWRFASPDRGDIIVFKSPTDGDELIKRVIGLPGDDISIRGGRVFINGSRYPEPYVQGETTCAGECAWTVPDGEYFVLGDNRENSRDSREGWTVPISAIDGKKLLSY